MRTHDSQADGADAALYRKLIRQRFRAELAVAQSRLAFERLASPVRTRSTRRARTRRCSRQRWSAPTPFSAPRPAIAPRACALTGDSSWRLRRRTRAGATRSGLGADSIEALYWHVKDCCARGADFSRASDVDALFAFFDGLAREWARPSATRRWASVPLCAQWVLLEEELRHLQRRVRELAGGEDERRGEATSTPFAAAATAPALVATPATCATPTSGPWSGATTWAFENGVRDGGEAAWCSSTTTASATTTTSTRSRGTASGSRRNAVTRRWSRATRPWRAPTIRWRRCPSPRPGATGGRRRGRRGAASPCRRRRSRARDGRCDDLYAHGRAGEGRESALRGRGSVLHRAHGGRSREANRALEARFNPTTSVFPDEGKAAEAERPWFKSLEICTSPAKDAGLEAEGAPSRTPAAVPPPEDRSDGAAMLTALSVLRSFLTVARGHDDAERRGARSRNCRSCCRPRPRERG